MQINIELRDEQAFVGRDANYLKIYKEKIYNSQNI
jgi:hypothetical protein